MYKNKEGRLKLSTHRGRFKIIIVIVITLKMKSGLKWKGKEGETYQRG